MQKIIGRVFLLLALTSNVGNAGMLSDSVFVNRILVSNSAKRAILNSVSPGDNVARITNKDDMVLYYASVGVINPTKKKYNVEIICTDVNGEVVIQGEFKRLLSTLEEHVGRDTVKRLLLVLTLDPKPGAMAPGQLMPLKDNMDYYVKLFIEKKLVGVTNFSYEIEK